MCSEACILHLVKYDKTLLMTQYVEESGEDPI